MLRKSSALVARSHRLRATPSRGGLAKSGISKIIGDRPTAEMRSTLQINKHHPSLTFAICLSMVLSLCAVGGIFPGEKSRAESRGQRDAQGDKVSPDLRERVRQGRSAESTSTTRHPTAHAT